jgi:hypothetical protein
VATFDATKIEFGVGELFLAIYSGSSVTPPGTVVGGTQGATVMYKPEFKDVEIDQVMSPVTSRMIGEECTLKVKLVESEMRNFAFGLNLNPDDTNQLLSTPGVQRRMVFGGQRSPTYVYATLVTPKTEDTTKDFITKIYKARCVSGLELNFQKKDERVFELEFRGYPQSSSNNYVGEIIEEI